MVSFSVRRTTRLLYAVRLKRGTHEERHDVRTTRSTHVEVSGHEFHCNADGELTGPIPRRSWDVLPGAFTMMLPTSAQAETADEA
jgi:diacylglycerol kinase family enzyme